MRIRAFLVVASLAATASACAAPAAEGVATRRAQLVAEASPQLVTKPGVIQPVGVTFVADGATDIYGDASLDVLLTEQRRISLPAAGSDVLAGGRVPASFEAEADGRTVQSATAVRMRNGRVVTGRLLDDDGESIQLEIGTDSGGTATTRLRYSELHPRTVCELRSRRLPDDDASGHLAIGKYAADNGLYDIARVHYMHAGTLGGDHGVEADQRLMVLLDTASRSELARARSALDAGKEREGDRILERLQREFPGSAAAGEGARLYAARTARRAAVEREAALIKLFAPVDKLYAQALEHTRKGLAEAENSRRAAASFKAARDRVLQAEGRLGRLAKRNGSTDGVEAAVASTGDSLSSHFVANQIHLASVEMTRGKFDTALGAVNEAIGRDSSNREALSLRARIETGSAAARHDDEWRRLGRYHSGGIHRGFYPYGWRRFGHRGWRGTSLTHGTGTRSIGRRVSPSGAGSGNMFGGRRAR